MDYKELIGKLRQKDGCNCECLKAANAIETLLAERDKALKQLLYIQETFDMYGGEYGITVAFQKAEERDAAVEDLISACESLPIYAACQYCKNYPCLEKMNYECEEDGLSQFEWRGPQKEDKHETD